MFLVTGQADLVPPTLTLSPLFTPAVLQRSWWLGPAPQSPWRQLEAWRHPPRLQGEDGSEGWA